VPTNAPAKARGDLAPKRPPRGGGAKHIHEQLRKEILTLVLEPGTLLDEVEIGRRFHLSRSPAREALIRLSAEGLVRTLPNRGAVVAPFDVTVLPAYLEALELIYRLTAHLAALRRTPRSLARIVAAHERHEALGNAGVFLESLEANRVFHLAIAEATANPHFTTWTRTILEQGQRLQLVAVRHMKKDRRLGNHQALVEAIRRGNPQAAEHAACLDARNAMNELRDWLAESSTAGVRLP
jgi:DNA-binding GntR family transcriptional regulator